MRGDVARPLQREAGGYQTIQLQREFQGRTGSRAKGPRGMALYLHLRRVAHTQPAAPSKTRMGRVVG